MKDMLKTLYSLNRRVKSGETLSAEESEQFVTLFDDAKRFIGEIEDDYASTCLTERYINAKPWHQIADEMGQLTDDSVRKCCSRAIKKYM